ncbi:iron complex outermembrane receptor protein [Duganella sp. 1411]|uniref:TonB-dependent receptor plug domain-containing protein n=1 Tax=Duganella sp. 1411 TaxID=2806572 RepID=UPI001B52B394|nr:iron complex outermembrane receptor protein [Duganella sp. 1411]
MNAFHRPAPRFRLRQGTLLIVLALAAARAAAGPEPEELSTLPLESLMDVTMVTSASRFAQRVSDAPSAVSVLTSQDVREHGWRTLGDALASLPGLYVSSDRNYDYLGARGFLRPGDYDSRFLLLIDGVRVNDSVYDQASIGDDSLVDMDLVERIEYVPGPGAAVYGSNALFGVINVITKTGSALAGAQGAVSAGSRGERRGRASYGYHSQDGTDLLLSVKASTRRGDALYAPEYDTPEQNHGLAEGLDYQRAHGAFVKASRGGWGVSAGYIERVKGVPTASFGAVFNAPYHTRDTQSFASVAYNAAPADDVALSTRLDWGRADYLGVGWYPDAEGRVRQNIDGDHAAWYALNLNATFTGLAGHKLLAGLDAQRNARRDQFNFNQDPYQQELDDRRADSRLGAYVEDEMRLARKVVVNAGLRFDRDSITGTRLSPRAALIWQPGAADTLKLIYGTAYRSPNAYELYYAVGVADGGQAANPGLRAEEISTHELVWERQPDAYSKVSLAVFHYRISGLITETVRRDGMLMFDNTERASANGMELAAERLYPGGTRVRANYAWQRARDGDGASLVNSPRHLAKLNATWPLPGEALRLGVEGRCMSRRLTEHTTAAGYCNWNLTLLPARRRAAGLDWSLSFYNAGDHRYADPAGPAFVQEAIPREGRTIVTKIGYAF